MSPDATPDERLRAIIAVHGELIAGLWTFTLAEQQDPMDECEGAEGRSLESLEAMFASAQGREFTVTRDLALAQMEAFWKLIRAELASFQEPLDVAPTTYGRRLYDHHRRTGRTSPEEPPADDSGEAPDR